MNMNKFPQKKFEKRFGGVLWFLRVAGSNFLVSTALKWQREMNHWVLRLLEQNVAYSSKQNVAL